MVALIDLKLMTQKYKEVWDRGFKYSQKEIMTSYIDNPMSTVLITSKKNQGLLSYLGGSVYELFRVGVGKTSNPSY